MKSSYNDPNHQESWLTDHYQWIVVAAIFIFGIVAFGLRFSFSVFFKSLQSEFGWNRANTSMVFSVYMLLSAFLVIFWGWALDRHGARKVFLLSGFFVSLSLMLTSCITASWQLFITYSLLFALGTSPAYVSSMSTVSRWFTKGRGLALGIVAAGNGMGMIVFSPISAYLISCFGWQSSYYILSLIAFFTMIPCALLLKNPPDSGNLTSRDTNLNENNTVQELSLTQAVKVSSFWLMIGNLFFLSACAFSVLTHIVPHAIDIGFEPIRAASMLSFIGIGSLLGRLIMGGISDRVGSKRGMFIASLLMGISMLWLFGSSNLWMLFIFTFVFGFAFGATAPLNAALIGDTFGLRHVGLIMGVIEMGWESGAASGPALAGYIFDITGGYSWAFLGAGLAALLAAVFIIPIKKPYTSPSIGKVSPLNPT